MNLAKYCKNKGMNLKEYKQFKKNITAIAAGVIHQIPKNKKDNGMYFPIGEILKYDPNNKELFLFTIQELKNQGMEFIENNEYWRL